MIKIVRSPEKDGKGGRDLYEDIPYFNKMSF